MGKAALLLIPAVLAAVACHSTDGSPHPSGGSQCPGAPGCGCQSESGQTPCELSGVVDRPSASDAGTATVVATYVSAARPGAMGTLTLEVPAARVPAARAFLEAHRQATCAYQFESAPCPPANSLSPQLPPFPG